MGKISKIVRGRLGPFRVREILQVAHGAPLQASLEPLFDGAPGVEVFVRELSKCGPTLQIDDAMLRSLPPSGFFVAELVDDGSLEAIEKLQAITEQSLAPEVRARLQAQRARARVASGPQHTEEDVEPKSVAPIPIPVLTFDNEDDDDDDSSDDGGEGGDDDGGEANRVPPRVPESPVAEEPAAAPAVVAPAARVPRNRVAPRHLAGYEW
jgi:hypothetical protein